MHIFPRLRKPSFYVYAFLHLSTKNAKEKKILLDNSSPHLKPHERQKRNLTSTPISFEAVPCSQCGKEHASVESCAGDDLSEMEAFMDGINPFGDGPNVGDMNCEKLTGSQSHAKSFDGTEPLQNTASTSYPPETTVHSKESPSSQYRIHINNAELESKLRELSESKARLETDVRERKEFLLDLRRRRVKIAEESKKLRRSTMPSIEQTSPYCSPHSKTTTSAPSSPSAARTSCNEAYERMTPTQRHLMKDKLHWDGVRQRDIKEEQKERLEWERYRQYRHERPNSAPSAKPTTDREAKIRHIKTGAGNSQKNWQENEKHRHREAWELYESNWSNLRSRQSGLDRDIPELTFNQIPWPILNVFVSLPPSSSSKAVSDNFLDDIFSVESLSAFLFSAYHSGDKSKRQRIHEALLRYHPDRCSNRVLCFVQKAERSTVERAVKQIAGVLNTLLNNC